MRGAIFYILLVVFPLSLSAQLSDEELLRAIRHDEISIIRSYLNNKSNNPNRLYGDQKVPLIHYTSSIDKTETLKLLIKAGADVNKIFSNDSPLMIAIYFGNINTAEILLKNGAIPDLKNPDGKTAAMDAARYDKKEFLELLHSYHADFDIKDNTGKTATDYAFFLQNIGPYEYLCKITNCEYEKTAYKSYFDGPYVFWQSKTKAQISYLVNDSLQNKTYRLDSIVDIKKNDAILNNKFQAFEIDLRGIKKKKSADFEFSNVEKIMAIGDLHGEFDEFAKFLINNKIIDKNYHWIFGKGHLVLAGDIFDRGDKVNECFWLLYKLETEAQNAGGKVHFILGNHEIMEISGDKRYLGNKYLNLFNRLKLNYTNFYGLDTELGRWLRTKNTIIRINDLLFVHGGLSKELIDKDLSISTINEMVRTIINRKVPEAESETEKFVLGSSGPLWYRGYIKLDNNYYKGTGEKYDMSEKKLDEILKHYNASAIIFANTHVKQISPLYNFKAYGIDIPFAESNAEFQGLYIENNKFYRALINGEKQILH